MIAGYVADSDQAQPVFSLRVNTVAPLPVCREGQIGHPSVGYDTLEHILCLSRDKLHDLMECQLCLDAKYVGGDQRELYPMPCN